jgi:ATP-dependent exoDNAse (exonuclease V) beta subunit
MSSHARTAPPDQAQRELALDASRSILVRAPAGSGKTDLLTRRFLRLLAEVDDPTQIVAITFTKAAAAEMRNRILSKLEEAASGTSGGDNEFSMESLAHRALERSRALGWNLLDLPSQLRISTIDSFCREIALRRPLLSALGGGLDITEQAEELYRRAANRTLMQLGNGSADLQEAIESLLLWRDNNWQELEGHLATMLSQRDRWLQEFWVGEPDWGALRTFLERPFARAIAAQVAAIGDMLTQVPGACDEAMYLARFACENLNYTRYSALAELADFPTGPFGDAQELDESRQAYLSLADLLLKDDGTFRKAVNKGHGFPADHKREKQRLEELIHVLSDVEGLQAALAAISGLPPARYTEEDWDIVRASFTLLRHAAGQLQVAFAESGMVDYTEVAQIAQQILRGEDNLPSDAALDIADGIHHVLVDEFQDTSRRQHKLIASLVSAWPDTTNRTLFVVGDPMQSVYFFRDADAELFPRVQALGLELSDGEPWPLDFVPLQSNFRTHRDLVDRLNGIFEAVFAVNDGSHVQFSKALPARADAPGVEPTFELHLNFVPQISRGFGRSPDAVQLKQQATAERDAALVVQNAEIVKLIHARMDRLEQARARGEKFRIAVLGRKRASLAPIAQALRDASIPFRAVDLEGLADRPEVLDALALARALLNGEDRVAWLGVLRAPWCGLSLRDLHTLASADDTSVLGRPLSALLRERESLLGTEGRAAVNRVLTAYDDASSLRAAMPGISIGAWLEQVWRRLGGDACVDDTARTNLALLWNCLDRLPAGEPDLAGPALRAALEKLTALPDPTSESGYGVHLMTIHKSKGLEFEVVIVPEMQSGSGKSSTRMFSWLERGLEDANESGDITEFLIAPFQPKGGERGAAKTWVDRQYRAREAQETRRVLYVAATRAREELHLFARPEYKADSVGPALCEPRASLLSTAWPALEDEVRSRFARWTANAQPATVTAMAANADNVIEMPSPSIPAVLRRLPSGFGAPSLPISAAGRVGLGATDDARLYQRHEGGLESRALGSAVHRLLQELARLRTGHDEDAARANLAPFRERLASEARAHGFDRATASGLVDQAFDTVMRASRDPIAAWILSPHAEATNEQRWTGFMDGALRNVQADRVFRAGGTPMAPGNDAWWIVDYKTAQVDEAPLLALPRLRELFAPQLEIYARVLRKLQGEHVSVRAGLYYPRMLQFDWWEL